MFRIHNTAEDFHIHILNKQFCELVSIGRVTGLKSITLPQSSVVFYYSLVAKARRCSILIDVLGVTGVSRACGLTITFHNLEQFLATNPNVNLYLKSQHSIYRNYIERLINSETGQSFATALVQSFAVSGSTKLVLVTSTLSLNYSKISYKIQMV